MPDRRPIIGITMGDPVGIGPEIILLSLCNPLIYEACRPLVIGDSRILEAAKKCIQSRLQLESIKDPDAGTYKFGLVDVLNLSDLDPDQTSWGKPTVQTGRAMVSYITVAIDMATEGRIAAIVTCPINKMAMQIAGFRYNGHTELLAERTKSDDFAMMLAGNRLRVVLVTIHVPLKDVPAILSKQKILHTIRLTGQALCERFGLKDPRIAVAGLNPHAGEEGMFGDEEKNIILPAIHAAGNEGFDVSGPFPPDTIFYHAAKGDYDAVISMYHDQGLIPFKLLHFNDGVNTTLGLPIIRTSVDHGTAYDIAGTGIADPGSLIAALDMAARQAVFARKKQ
ncbi:MAG: 4-hydroxythreonine-4-phosphate dehydrogenase PdxA [Desulfobacterales bacterium PC51MH44]|nr:MAG: 4-hydroxythreonine-4-phosphate dehydrogenase PdxA [Desulfobacterales bacterium PC51MH44]